jgi:hypothetical protein
MSQRLAAEALGVSKTTVHDDLVSFRPENGQEATIDRDERREAAIINNAGLAAVEVSSRFAHLKPSSSTRLRRWPRSSGKCGPIK